MSSSDTDDHGQPLNRHFNRAAVADRTIDELIGLSRGLIADGRVDQGEAEFLAQWLANNREMAGEWPMRVLYPRVVEMLSDGLLDGKEQAELLELLRELSGDGVSVAYDAASLSSTLPVSVPAPAIEFDERVFCFTGKFVYGTRKECQRAVADLGGVSASTPTLKTDYLVIGHVGSRDWKHSSFGRKIQKSVDMEQGGKKIRIVSEPHWVDSLAMQI